MPMCSNVGCARAEQTLSIATRAVQPTDPATSASYAVGASAAAAVAIVGVAYILALAAGFMQVGFDAPIRDPVLAIMEGLTVLSAIAILVAVAVLYLHARAERRIFGLLALVFAVLFAGITSTVHFVELTAARQMGGAELAWPSAAYAAELLAWDWFLGLAMVCASLVFPDAHAERLLRRALMLSGLLALVGTVGPLVGDMRLQRIGIVGYAVVLPFAFFLLAGFFRHQQYAETNSAIARRRREDHT